MLKISISAGHGPETAGKRTPDGYKEFEFNYPTAQLVADSLSKYENVSILKVYESNRDVPLKERTTKANNWGAELYLSIHYNAARGSGWSSASGIETLVHQIATEQRSYQIAQKIHEHVIRATGRKNRGVKARPDLWEIRSTNMKGVLIECGFMTNREEALLMKSQEYREKVAHAIVEGIVNYYNLTKKSTPLPPIKDELYKVQIGAFSSKSNAEAQQQLAITKSFKDAIIVKEGKLNKVQIGAYSDDKNAKSQLKLAVSKGFKDAFIEQ